MNTKMKLKIAAGMLAAIVAGTMLVGTAVAAPRTQQTPGFNRYGMMRSFDTSTTFDGTTFAQMNSFMSRYLTNGGLDFNRMHADVTSGKVKPPCFGRTAGAKNAPAGRRGYASPQRGYGMMSGLTSNNASIGNGMMGSVY